ncbi:MAG: GTPase HflX [Acidobacteria bacterium]|nr:GTPase HflX [Acidobacteriota bacterium]
MPSANHQGRETAILVGLEWKQGACRGEPPYTVEESLEELGELARSAGAEVLDRVVQSRERPEAATLIGSGKAEELRSRAAGLEAAMVLFDHDLTPTQQRNLERELGVKVIDRTQLILDIFARRARTREGQLQVELAQLNYLLPRLAGRGVEMSRLGGGIGTRGPGETKLETDRRRIARRIRNIQVQLEAVRESRGQQRSQRVGVPLDTIALAGYTNAGKSTLFNALTSAGVLESARLFATLDPTLRSLELPSRHKVLVSDTVGFIRGLPTTLVQAFRATLEEVRQAALILHVLDLSSPHRREQACQVEKVLHEIGAHDRPHMLVLNKIDKLEEPERTAWIEAEKAAWPSFAVAAVSALTGEGIPELLQALDQSSALEPVSEARFHFGLEEGGKISFLHDHAKVLETRYSEAGVEVWAAVTESVLRRLREHVV